jgi:tRNA(Ile)-lysidine synthase
MVAAECAALGHPHATLRWRWDGQGNLQDAARRARLALIDRWRGGIEHVLLAHTRDDVAETFVMRLLRGSGVEGLSAMAERRFVAPHAGRIPALPQEDVTATARPPVPAQSFGFHVIRPLLGESRAELLHHIDTLKVPHVDDPSNEDPAFERARIRAALRDLGIGADTLAATAHRMARAREALQARAADVAGRLVRQSVFGTLHIDRDGFAGIERDTQLRLLAAALRWISSAPYRPRAAATESLLDRVLAGGGGTLHGAQVEVLRDEIDIFREFAAVSAEVATAGPSSIWDGRWTLHGPEIQGFTIRALGDDGWRQIPQALRDGTAPDLPRHAIARTLPAIFDGERLVGFRPQHFGVGYVVEFHPPCGHFLALLNPH